ncbi:Single-stranded-DNA-specific exonuclease RecJ [Pelotomaculum sp. FP]|uniref:single-stranded-DNA-specific exonuclease RecJ n=1 Tax=Pelotomaculum sp. FP TaxID=261474 RepID=UPI0010651D9A|nr:single-stranded-DNA-specific exonuclease RecJ [Pelotomaculum sp. FP]TEB13084.1 Single-stranded-DNA-specific exonuclease RecJ [Pelotomaculum sp. FP]
MNNITRNNQKIWRVKASAPALSQILSRKLGISPLMAQLLVNRGIYTVEHARDYLGCELESLHRPGLMRDMPKAVARILKAIRFRDKIMVYGDYDVDGVTATALLIRAFQHLGVDVKYHIPNRLTEGYGLRLDVLKQAASEGINLVITLDCGISSIEEALWAHDNGLDLIITDHHEPGAELPRAFAVVNPKRPDCKYPYKDLAGVGVALKLAQALLEEAGMGSLAWQEYLDLACLGTIADIVPLQGENRIIVKHGLTRLARTENAGLQALIAVSELVKEELGARQVGFGLAPRLNAAGRMKSPDPALKLLLSDNTAEAWELAAELNRLNQERQKIESEVFEEIKKMLDERPEMAEDRVLVLASPGWHVGVIGIVASRLVNIYTRPVLLIALQDGEGKGSARSVPGFNMHQALSHCQALLLSYGGHASAAGFSIEKGRIEDFRRELNLYAGETLHDEGTTALVELDGIISMEQVSEKLVNELDLLRPIGHHNPGPLLGCRQATVLKCRGVGRGAAHLKMLLQSQNSTFDGIGFNLGAYAEVLATAEEVDLAFVPGINEYNGRSSIQLEVKELGMPAVLDTVEAKQTGFLRRVGYVPTELFIPEFVLLKLRYALQNSEMHGRVNKITRAPLKLEDWRGLDDRPGALAGIASRGEPTVVLTSCGYRTIELAHFLQLAVPSLAGRVAFCHTSSQEAEKDRIVQCFRDGTISTIVTTPATAGELAQHAVQTIIYDLPYEHEAFCCGVNTVRPGGSLYLLFSPDDLHENREALGNLAPDREFLASLYRILLREHNKGNLGNCTAEFITGRMRAAGHQWVHHDMVRVCLGILEELELLTVKGVGHEGRLELYPPPRRKRDLMEAKTYQYLHQLKDKALSWMEKLVDERLHSDMDDFPL